MLQPHNSPPGVSLSSPKTPQNDLTGSFSEEDLVDFLEKLLQLHPEDRARLGGFEGGEKRSSKVFFGGELNSMLFVELESCLGVLELDFCFKWLGHLFLRVSSKLVPFLG